MPIRIAVVGSGYVGLVAGACFADLGHEVILVDNDQKKLAALRDGQVPIHEKFLPELLKRHRGQRITFSDDLKAAARLSSVIFVAVGTPPTERGDADLSYVESVAREISGGAFDACDLQRIQSARAHDRWREQTAGDAARFRRNQNGGCHRGSRLWGVRR